jgi:predicted CxxxxCH...CXXCH cytochrome family protein
MTRRLAWLVCQLAALSLLPGCREPRAQPAAALTFDAVQPLLARACLSCHGAARAEARFRVNSYYELLGCTASGAPAVRPMDERAPIVAVLARADHAALLTTDERDLLLVWVEAGAPGRDGTVHGTDILDPRSDGWHGKLARAEGFAPLRAAESDLACGRCHDGAPVRPPAVRFAAPNAPACTSCHDEPLGVLACTTCHGKELRAHPPRDDCYFADSKIDVHASHVGATRFRQTPFDCALCHPTPGPDLFASAHVNGKVDLQFAAIAGADSRYAPESDSCSVACHQRGGEHPTPRWGAALPLDCNSCHLSPPLAHYAGVCSRCHTEMGEGASSLTPGALHLNGVVDFGSGDGSCGACHGERNDPWPRDAVHLAHRDTQLTTAIECTSCHEVPTVVAAPGHLDGRSEVRFAGRALFAPRAALYDASDKSCRNVACHAGALAQAPLAVQWTIAAPPGDGCSGCHSAPPPPPHVQQPGCGGALCHGAEVAGGAPTPAITASGRALHIDGVVEVGR